MSLISVSSFLLYEINNGLIAENRHQAAQLS